MIFLESAYHEGSHLLWVSSFLLQLFLSCLYNLQLTSILTEIDRDKLFSNIADIYVANRSFWMDCILPMVQKAKDTRNPLQPSDLLYGFLNVITSTFTKPANFV